MTDDNPSDKKHDKMLTVLNLHGTNIYITQIMVEAFDRKNSHLKYTQYTQKEMYEKGVIKLLVRIYEDLVIICQIE